MEFTEANCNKVIDLMENDEGEGMEMMMDLLNSYRTKYKIKTEALLAKDFRKDTKLIFEILRNGLASDKMIKEMDEEFTDSEIDKKEKEEYMNFTENINFVVQKIDTVDLRNPDDEFSSNCTQAMSFINKKNEEMNEFKDTMKEFNATMKKITVTIDSLGN
tara:strand:+ start:143 stop:625 length:483 start_codon:yes stop_codon:yes gene_type:complete